MVILIKRKRAVDEPRGLEQTFKVKQPHVKSKEKMFYKNTSYRLKKYNIHHFYTEQELKACIVERFNRT